MLYIMTCISKFIGIRRRIGDIHVPFLGSIFTEHVMRPAEGTVNIHSRTDLCSFG